MSGSRSWTTSQSSEGFPYASLIVYDDRNSNSTLDLQSRPEHNHHDDDESPTDYPPVVDDGGASGSRDLVYAASFISMTQPDRRVAFREGGFDAKVAFYPRAGCDEPPKGFSILSAGGFSATEAYSSSIEGQLPPEDRSTCSTATLDDTVVLTVQAPGNLSQLACTGDKTTYRKPKAAAPDLTGRTFACARFSHIPGDDAGSPTGQQLIVTNSPSEACRYVDHFTLRGCDDDPSCAEPSWDLTASPPSWWPCSTSP